MLANSHRLASAVQDLLMAGARPEQVDNQKRTSLMLALLAYKNQGCEHVGVTFFFFRRSKRQRKFPPPFFTP